MKLLVFTEHNRGEGPIRHDYDIKQTKNDVLKLSYSHSGNWSSPGETAMKLKDDGNDVIIKDDEGLKIKLNYAQVERITALLLTYNNLDKQRIKISSEVVIAEI